MFVHSFFSAKKRKNGTKKEKSCKKQGRIVSPDVDFPPDANFPFGFIRGVDLYFSYALVDSKALR